MAGNAQKGIRIEIDQNAYEKLGEQEVVHLVAGDSFDEDYFMVRYRAEDLEPEDIEETHEVLYR